MQRKHLIALGAVSLTCSLAAAQNLKPEYIAQATERTIQLDGDLKDWNGLPKYTIEMSNGFPSVPVGSKGYFQVAYDQRNLYLVGVFDQEKSTVLAKLAQDAPEWWNDDVLEIYFQPNRTDKVPTTQHFAISPSGVRFKNYTATTEYQTASKIEDNRWIVEVAFPLGQGVFASAQDGSAWNLKVGREHQKAGEYPLWPMGGDFNAETNYGILSFNKTLQDANALLSKYQVATEAAAPIQSQLSDISSFATYYGQDAQSISKLSNFDLAITQPVLTRAQLDALHENGTRVVAYLSIGELDPGSVWASEVKDSWVLGTNENWGSKFINASETGWQDIMVRETGKLLAQGYDGVFLDTLDTADVYPQAASGLVATVSRLRSTYPNAVIVQNRGFSLLKQTAEQIDAVMFEGFSSAWDFSKKEYHTVQGDPNFVAAYAKRGLVVLAQDYANSDDTHTITSDYLRARQFGFIPYVSNLMLDQLYIPEL
ncbi:endo alpha-1,4 polygalactosaminidase [Deinococcus misasensis]|uniref:endo alpha-1,4 polygalactosaminidase n=1 Tax=Deinococcus misasensis TaxID=392413 RepID=UPI0005541538|nr:endo alpha-1,4 polygalactosaminidase [Deinococcus misasensis]